MLTPEEHYKLYGNLNEEIIEELLDNYEEASEDNIAPHIHEALAQYPAEDFLEDIKNQLIDLSKNVRGNNKDKLLGILESLDDIAQCTFNASEYGKSELNKLI